MFYKVMWRLQKKKSAFFLHCLHRVVLFTINLLYTFLFVLILIPVFSLFFQIHCTYLMSGTSVKEKKKTKTQPQTKEPQEILRARKNNDKIANKDYSFRDGLEDNFSTRNSLLINQEWNFKNISSSRHIHSSSSA